MVMSRGLASPGNRGRTQRCRLSGSSEFQLDSLWERRALAIVKGMDELGDDLLLLTARPDGTLALSPKLRFGLSGAELVRLAAARRVDIARGRIAVLDTAPTG